ncbi:hypothetical protein CWB41_12080 [Methylovirgula ligni]|uniref:Uncharacterized protein n=1 Tax=Methylovirgula ligni TaxID=569860 RepID=A0A3D9YW02_9HYPH|nr:hypothetical protein [Methylovirgula ligni]QAY96376.1 hypothetical protein CWB41_12080 [Methylovirgula ligni]REF85901.1 hypothetical protein DES32_1940 [Methylovirgula ligni]
MTDDQQPEKKHSLLRDLLMGMIAAAIVEAFLFVLSLLGLQEASNTVFEQAKQGLEKLTPLSFAEHYLQYAATWINSNDYGNFIKDVFLGFLAFVFFPFHLMFTEPPPAAVLDLIQFAFGVAVTWYVLRKKWPKLFDDTAVFGFVIIVFTSLFATTVFASIMLALVFVVAGLTSIVIPADHALPMTYAGVFCGGTSFVFHQGMEGVVHKGLGEVAKE